VTVERFTAIQPAVSGEENLQEASEQHIVALMLREDGKRLDSFRHLIKAYRFLRQISPDDPKLSKGQGKIRKMFIQHVIREDILAGIGF